jgi:hypothetical protein
MGETPFFWEDKPGKRHKNHGPESGASARNREEEAERNSRLIISSE